MLTRKKHFCKTANKRELVTDLITKAKQIEILIQSLPVPESEDDQVCDFSL